MEERKNIRILQEWGLLCVGMGHDNQAGSAPCISDREQQPGNPKIIGVSGKEELLRKRESQGYSCWVEDEGNNRALGRCRNLGEKSNEKQKTRGRHKFVNLLKRDFMYV